jgi:hypothetical protein
MNSPLVHCSKCNAVLLDGVFNQPDVRPCPSCAAPLQIEVYPALFRRISPGRSGETILVEGEASCFYHPQKKAALPCDGCGRFLCALCDCEMDGRHFCPACLEAGRTKGKIKNLQNNRTLYDSIALGLAVIPILFFYFSIITAPIALFIAIRHWNSPMSIVRRSKVRYILAIIAASLQIAGWVTLFGYLIFK